MNQPSLNQGLADPSITGLIVRAPLSSAFNNPTRDRLTGLPLDGYGRYEIQITIGDRTYSPRYSSCATSDCIASGKNIDMSDPEIQVYIKAIDRAILDDINKGATVAGVLSPVGIAGKIIQVLGPITSVAGGYMSDQGGAALSKELIQVAATQYISRIYGLGEASASRIASAVDLAGGWQSFVNRLKAKSGNQ